MKRFTLFVLLVVFTLSSFELSAASPKTMPHIVNPAETLYTIALRYGVDIDTFVEDNPNTDLLDLKAGQRLAVRRIKRKERTSDDQITAQWKRFQAQSEQLETQQEQMPGEDKAPEQDIKVADFKPLSRSGFKKLDKYSPLNVAMLLPLNSEQGSASQFIDFYRGALLALDELKKEQREVSLNVYNTARSEQTVQDLIDSGELDEADLIIGPVFEAPFKLAAEYAAQLRVPIVSPLATMSDLANPYVFQAPVSQGDRYGSLKPLLSADNNVIVFSGASDDKELLAGLQALLPANTRTVEYSKELEVEVMEEMLEGKKENVFIILPSAELEVDEILARLSSVQSNLKVRSIKDAPISVIGSSKWLRFANIDRTLYFKLKLNSVTTYHADRGNLAVREFGDSYLKTYGSLPSLYSYRGYDVAKMFVYGVGMYGGDFADNINKMDVDLLQTPYYFEKDELGKYINTEWVRVVYDSDFNIKVFDAKQTPMPIYDYNNSEKQEPQSFETLINY